MLWRNDCAQVLLEGWAQSDLLEQPRGVASLTSDYLKVIGDLGC